MDVVVRLVQPRRVVVVQTLVFGDELAELILDQVRTGLVLGGKNIEDLVECACIRVLWIDDACEGIKAVEKLQGWDELHKSRCRKRSTYRCDGSLVSRHCKDIDIQRMVCRVPVA